MALAGSILLDALAAEGLDDEVVEVDGWRARGRPYTFSPRWIVNHHTAAPRRSTWQSSLAVLTTGNSVAPGPIANIYISREPRIYVVAAGYCNHAGAGKYPDGTSGNGGSFSIEVDNDGLGEFWGDEQIRLYQRVNAALLRWHRWGLDHVILHATYAPTRKIDPAGPASWNDRRPGTWQLDRWREQIGLYLLDRPAPTPTPPSQEENLMSPMYFGSAAGEIWCLDPYTGATRAVSGQEWYDLLPQSARDSLKVLSEDRLQGIGVR